MQVVRRFGWLPVLLGIFLSGCTLPGQNTSSLLVNSMNGVSAEVFLADKKVGDTPFKKDSLKSGVYPLRVVPTDTTRQPYETTITLNSGANTTLNWDFGSTVDLSQGELYEYGKAKSGSTSDLSVVTIPDNAIVRVNSQSKGFAPLVMDGEAPGSKQIQVSAPGYKDRTVQLSLAKGQKVTITVKLATDRDNYIVPTPPVASPSPNATAAASKAKTSPIPSPKARTPKSSPTPELSSSPSASSSGTRASTGTPKLPYVQVETTPTGWLRVRESANATSTELGRLNVGDKVPYLNQTTNGWHKVEYLSGKTGWVSGQWAVVFDH